MAHAVAAAKAAKQQAEQADADRRDAMHKAELEAGRARVEARQAVADLQDLRRSVAAREDAIRKDLVRRCVLHGAPSPLLTNPHTSYLRVTAHRRSAK